jgi:hypothetical protein
LFRLNPGGGQTAKAKREEKLFLRVKADEAAADANTQAAVIKSRGQQ